MLTRLLVFAAGLLVAAGAQAQVWSGSEHGASIAFSLAEGGPAVFAVECEPSASGGRTIPIFSLRLPLDRVTLGEPGPSPAAEMRLWFEERRREFPLDTPMFRIEQHDAGPSAVFEAYGGGDAREPTARAILSRMSRAPSVTVTARLGDGPWLSQSIPLQGSRAALRKTWCGDGSR